MKDIQKMTTKEIEDEIAIVQKEREEIEVQMQQTQNRYSDNGSRLIQLKRALVTREMQKHTINLGDILCVKEETWGYHTQPFTIYKLTKQTSFGFECIIHKYRIDDGDRSFSVTNGTIYNKEIVSLCAEGNTKRITEDEFNDYIKQFINLEIGY